MNMHSFAHMPRVLVVEDESLVRLALCDYLEGCGFRVVEAADAAAAVRLLEKAGPGIDLVFSDIRMPGEMDGFELAEWIHGHKPAIPVILTSGDIGKAGRAYDLAAGDVFLPKPYSFDDLAEQIRNRVNRPLH